jgi:hypothetical protein
MADLVDHLTGVVDRAVVGAKLNDRQAERPRSSSAFSGAASRISSADTVVKAVLINTANKANGLRAAQDTPA